MFRTGNTEKKQGAHAIQTSALPEGVKLDVPQLDVYAGET